MTTHPAFECFIAYAPRGPGLLCAVVYMVRGNNVCGWWVGRNAMAEYQPGYFMIENYYTKREQAFLTTSGGDLIGGWTHDYDARQRTLDPALPIDDAVARALDSLQFEFAREWLVYPDNADVAEQTRRYADAELAMGSMDAGSVAVRFRCLGRFEKSQPVWRYFSHGLDYKLIERLMRYWPLEYGTSWRA